MKGIILAGGTGSRLFPLTHVIVKQLLPVFDKPMIYYPLSTLMMMGIDDICIISSKQDLPAFQRLLGDGSHLNITITYKIQEHPEGIAQAFLIAEDFIHNQRVALILGDNIFYGPNMQEGLLAMKNQASGAGIFGYEVEDPSRYGVLAFNEDGIPVQIIEKPATPPSNYAVTGLYLFDERVASFAKQLKPSKRGELEITDLSQIYLDEGSLSVHLFDRGFAWLDMGTHKSLHQAASFVETIQERQGITISCIEEIAFNQGWISLTQLKALAKREKSSSYGEYLCKLIRYAENKSQMPALALR